MNSPTRRIRSSLRRATPPFVQRLIVEGKLWSTRHLLLRGDRFHCPFCGRGYSRFDAAGVTSSVFERESVVGGGVRRNARCPGCRSLERERLMFLSRDRFMPAHAGRGDAGEGDVGESDAVPVDAEPVDVLHFAPERNTRHRLARESGIRYVTADLFADDVDRKLDVCALDVADASFDVIICNHVLEHVADDARAMRELLRVLRPGGAAVLQVPIAVSLEHTLEDATVVTEAEREARFGQRDHARLYGLDYRERLRSAGFELESYLPEADLIERYGLDPREVLFIARRPG